MAQLIPHYDLGKAIGAFEVTIEAPTVAEMIEEGVRRFGPGFAEGMRAAAIMVNGRNIAYLGGMKTPLGADDTVQTATPAAGG